MTTAGFSAREVARFASPEGYGNQIFPCARKRGAFSRMLGRAWFTLPLCEVLRSVQVGVASAVALRTSKVVAITGSHRPTRRTPLAGMVRINLLDANTSAFGFVRDELLELVETP